MDDSDNASAELSPSDPRPLGAALAAIVMAALGGGLAVIGLGQFGPHLASSLAGPSDDFLIFIDWLVTLALLAVVVAIVAAVAMHLYAAVRIWIGARWAWIEGLFTVPLGAVAYAALFGLDENVEPTLTPELVVAGAAYLFVVAALLLVRDWFGPIRLSPDRSDWPWWLRAPPF